jgi:hypothetical protein
VSFQRRLESSQVVIPFLSIKCAFVAQASSLAFLHQLKRLGDIAFAKTPLLRGVRGCFLLGKLFNYESLLKSISRFSPSSSSSTFPALLNVTSSCIGYCIFFEKHIIILVTVKRRIKINKVNAFIGYVLPEYIKIIAIIKLIISHDPLIFYIVPKYI